MSECYCGSDLKLVPLPKRLRELSGEHHIYVHVHNGDTRWDEMCEVKNEHGERMCGCGHPWRQHQPTLAHCFGGNGTCPCAAPHDPTSNE